MWLKKKGLLKMLNMHIVGVCVATPKSRQQAVEQLYSIEYLTPLFTCIDVFVTLNPFLLKGHTFIVSWLHCVICSYGFIDCSRLPFELNWHAFVSVALDLLQVCPVHLSQHERASVQ